MVINLSLTLTLEYSASWFKIKEFNIYTTQDVTNPSVSL